MRVPFFSCFYHGCRILSTCSLNHFASTGCIDNSGLLFWVPVSARVTLIFQTALKPSRKIWNESKKPSPCGYSSRVKEDVAVGCSQISKSKVKKWNATVEKCSLTARLYTSPSLFSSVRQYWHDHAVSVKIALCQRQTSPILSMSTSIRRVSTSPSVLWLSTLHSVMKFNRNTVTLAVP
jgi:hypothetical protein